MIHNANTYIQQAADLLRTIDEDAPLQSELRRVCEQKWRDLTVLRRFEAYRRGTGTILDCPSPHEITEALERVIREMKQQFKDD